MLTWFSPRFAAIILLLRLFPPSNLVLHAMALPAAADFDRVRVLIARAVTGAEKDGLYRYFMLAKLLANSRAAVYADTRQFTHSVRRVLTTLAIFEEGLRRALARGNAGLGKEASAENEGRQGQHGHALAEAEPQRYCRGVPRTSEQQEVSADDGDPVERGRRDDDESDGRIDEDRAIH